MADGRSVQIGHDAPGNVIVTGDDNRVYVFPGITQLTPELIEQLHSGGFKPHEAPGAVPLPTLTLRLVAPQNDPSTWTAIRYLRDTSLLTEVQQRHSSGRQERYFEVHPYVAHLAQQHATATRELLRQGHRIAGDFLAERALRSPTWSDDIEAAYHLGEVGEADRAFGLLLSVSQWLLRQGRNLDAQAILALLKDPAALSMQNQGRLLSLHSEAYVGLGNLPRATAGARQAVAI